MILLDRVVTTRMKRMTPENSPERHPQPLAETVSEKRLTGVLRAGGIITTAGGKQRRESRLIDSDEKDDGFGQDEFLFLKAHRCVMIFWIGA
jgi:hypothetical protein